MPLMSYMKNSPNKSLETDLSILEQHTVLANTLKKKNGYKDEIKQSVTKECAITIHIEKQTGK